jgi:hypothetical protein
MILEAEKSQPGWLCPAKSVCCLAGNQEGKGVHGGEEREREPIPTVANPFL